MRPNGFKICLQVNCGKTALTMRLVSQRHGINPDGTLPDGLWNTEDLDGAKDMDSKQSTIGLTFQESVITQILREASKFQEQISKEPDSHHLENHALPIHHYVKSKILHLTGLEYTWIQRVAWSTDSGISQWRQKILTLSNLLLGFKPIQETHGKK